VFEAPLDQGAYYGPEAFGASLWQRVEPIVTHYPGPFVLVGISRGGLVALDTARASRKARQGGQRALAVGPVAAPCTSPR
jgi:surfactin synthase thioesterase subunit